MPSCGNLCSFQRLKSKPAMTFYILRGTFILLIAAVAAFYLIPNQEGANLNFYQFAVMFTAVLLIGGLVIGWDVSLRKKRLAAISGVFLGLIAGLVAAFALSFVIDLFGLLYRPEVTAVQPQVSRASEQYYRLPDASRKLVDTAWMQYNSQLEEQDAFLNLLEGVKVVVGLITCYIGISLVLQTKDDFRFILPYIEFAKEVRGQKHTVVDTSVIIDGRIVDLLQTHIIQGMLIVPRFVLDELQAIADSSDKLKRARGRRGLEVLQKLQDVRLIEVHIDDSEVEGASVDLKLISLCELRQGRLMTNDYNLNKIASLRGIEVVNLNDLCKALRPVVLPGEMMNVRIVKAGEGPTQGVGYLDDGTMVVVEHARDRIGQELDATVTSTLQTSAGRMIFARYEGPATPAKSTQAAQTTSASPAESTSPPTGPHAANPARNPRRSS
ncbi:MAG: TRAM domain-containing protein [Phycisphaeraceae bacterium]|nr:TRAM domain-containing protein [Phycisphaeraceae bacterium]